MVRAHVPVSGIYTESGLAVVFARVCLIATILEAYELTVDNPRRAEADPNKFAFQTTASEGRALGRDASETV